MLGSKTVEENTAIGSLIQDLEKLADASNAYTFAGWKTVVGDNAFDEDSVITANMGVYAEYTATPVVAETTI